MRRSPEKQEFLNVYYGYKDDTDPLDEEITASPEEVKWREQQKIWDLRSIAKKGEATRPQLIYLASKGFYYRATPKEHRRKVSFREED